MKNMKKRIFCLVMAGVMLSLSISVSAANTSAADPFDHYDDFTIEDFAAMNDMTAEQNMIRYFQDQVDNSSYGGIYYDENGVLVVNIVRANYDEFSAVPTTFSDGTSVEYRVVEYSLQELETVKDTLAGYMNQYRIAMLDANEMTNQVDVALFIAIFKKANNKRKRQTNAGNPAVKQNQVPYEPRQGASPDFGPSIHEGGPSSWTTSSQWDSDRDCRAEGIVPSFPFPPGPPGQPLHGESAYCPSQQCLRA